MNQLILLLFCASRAPPQRLECPPTRPEIALREFRRFRVQCAAVPQPRSRPAAVPQPPQPPPSRSHPAAAPQPRHSSTATNSHRGARPQDDCRAPAIIWPLLGWRSPHAVPVGQLARCHNSLDSFDCSHSRRQAPDPAGRLRMCNWEMQKSSGRGWRLSFLHPAQSASMSLTQVPRRPGKKHLVA